MPLTFGAIGISGIIRLVWESHQEEKAKQIKKDQEPAYTEEEQFYAELLLMKHDLDADAFAIRKAMLDEFQKYNKG